MTLAVQLLIILLGLILLGIIIIAAVQKKITEQHALLWIVPCLLIIIGGIFPQLTYFLSDAFHTDYPPAIIFSIAIIMAYLILFHCFKNLEIAIMKNKELASYVALQDKKIQLLEEELCQCQKTLEEMRKDL